ncbi:MAG: type II toxin-antitoxin system VapC family toxin [Deltaproteobacteria bacterium]|nr:type II toxin-antitoxin system VapC family toxin [Deltaproteobacteria bacterium]
MNLLLDTHALLWLLCDPGRLGDTAARAIASPSSRVAVSAATAWEIAIKQSIGKLVLPGPAESWLGPVVSARSIEWIPVTVEDALAVRALAWHHRDPFDRLIVAQALRGGWTLVSRDPALVAYGVPTL